MVGSGASGVVSVTAPAGTATIAGFTYYMIYEFTGSGNWSNTANWKNGLVPPITLTNNAEVIINPTGTAECVVDVVGQTLSSGTKVTVRQGKKIWIVNKFNLLTGGKLEVL